MRTVTLGPCSIVFDVIKLRNARTDNMPPHVRDCLKEFLRTIRERGKTCWATEVEGVYIIEECEHLVHLASRWNGTRITALSIIHLQSAFQG
jgi:hypothetical protein